MVTVVLIVIIVILLVAVVALLYFQNETCKKLEKSKKINSDCRLRISQQDSQNKSLETKIEFLNSQVRELSQSSGSTAESGIAIKERDESNEKLRDSHIANKKVNNTLEMWESQAKKYASENEQLKTQNSRFQDALNRMQDYPELKEEYRELREQNEKLLDKNKQLEQRCVELSSSMPKQMAKTASTEKRSTPSSPLPLPKPPISPPSETPVSRRSSAMTESVVSYTDAEKRKSINYLELCRDIEALDKMDSVQYLSARVGVTGRVTIYVAGNYRNADVMMLPEGEILPNPYNYTSLFMQGELGVTLKRLSPFFPSVCHLAEDAHYVMTAIVPAQCKKQGSDSYQLVHKGEITFACFS